MKTIIIRNIQYFELKITPNVQKEINKCNSIQDYINKNIEKFKLISDDYYELVKIRNDINE